MAKCRRPCSKFSANLYGAIPHHRIIELKGVQIGDVVPRPARALRKGRRGLSEYNHTSWVLAKCLDEHEVRRMREDMAAGLGPEERRKWLSSQNSTASRSC